MKRSTAFIAIVSMVTANLLSACGGGGGGSNGGGGGASPPAAPAAPVLTLAAQSIKTFAFSWADVSGETEYRLLENRDGSSGFTTVATIAANAISHELVVFLPSHINASYILEACNSGGCGSSAPVFVGGTLETAAGYVKASNAGSSDYYGLSVALAADGNTLAIGAHEEDSSATGIDGDQNDNTAGFSGAVYVFSHNAGIWSQQAYVKASNAGIGDRFGTSVALAADGNTLAVGTMGEASNTTGIGGDQNDNSAAGSGAVYVFSRSGTVWSQQAYVKASNTGADDLFGYRVALAADGNTLAVGAYNEDSSATGIDGDQNDDTTADSGAVYVFSRSGTVWSQQAYVKATNAGANDVFGISVALAADGNTLAVGANGEDSNATGIDGDQQDNTVSNSGAVYVFVRGADSWRLLAYVKASNTGESDRFGMSVALAADGNTLAVGASGEASNATGIDGNQNDNTAGGSGAVYVFSLSGSLWSQQAYVKASNTEANDLFGRSVALAADGNTLAVAAYAEDSSATGIDGNQYDNTASLSGAVYVYSRSGTVWSQQAYVKATNTEAGDSFGISVALAADGNTLAVGAYAEDSSATGIGGNQDDNSAGGSGAVYVY